MNCIEISLDNIIRLGEKEEQEKVVIPTKKQQEILPDLNKTLSKVTVEAISDDYIIPSGELEINEQGIFSVKEYESVNIKAPFDKLFNQYLNNTLTEITEQDLEGATSLRASLFEGQKNLVKVSLPDTITSIEDKCFSGCSALVSVKLPKYITSINAYMFNGCRNLGKLVIPDLVKSIGDYALANESGMVIYMPNNNVTLSYLNRMYCTNSSVHTPNLSKFCSSTFNFNGTNGGWRTGSVFYINEDRITDLVIPEDVSVIGTGIFSWFTNIKTVDFKNVSLIRDYSFYNCTNLEKVRMEQNITRINSAAFQNCTKLTEIIIDKPCSSADDVPTLANATAIPNSANIYVPDVTTQELFKAATNWSSFASRILVKESE